jgi:hypothetical protein
MSNTFAPQGFLQTQGTGTTPSYEITQMAVSSSNTGPIFSGDPVMPAASNTGVATGYITQGYAPVTVTISGITFASGVATATITAITSGVPGSPNAWAPPVGGILGISGASSFATGGAFTGSFTITSATTTTALFSAPVGTFSSTYTGGTAVIYSPVFGVFDGCKYLSASQKRVVWTNYWPGSDANTAAAVTANVINDPSAQFVVQTGNTNTTTTAVGLANLGANASFGYVLSGGAQVNGNTANGLSSFFLDQYTIGPGDYLPFKILSLPGYSPDGNNPFSTIGNNDYTAAYNNVQVGFNNMQLKVLRGV